VSSESRSIDQQSLALTEGGDDHTHFSGQSRRWGGPEWIAKAMVCRVRENAYPRRIQPFLSLTGGGDDQSHFLGPPRRWRGPDWSAKTMVPRGRENA